MKTHIVIPIGVGAPGTPVQEYLEASVNSILNQTTQDYILTIAADSDIPERCKEFLSEKNIEVKWFEPHTYFRKGGIWKKIFDTWKDKDTEFIAFLHYDDLWDNEKLQIQHDKIIADDLLGCWSEAYLMESDGSVPSGDYSWPILSKNTVGGRTLAFSHSIIVSRKAMFESGILEYEHEWAANFEDMWSLFFHKIKNVKKAPGAKFYWRNHSMNISNTVHESAEFVINQRQATTYTLEETMSDMNRIGFNDLITNIKRFY
jgi:glycosyltransferase involved in cell wall biosynthesis